MKHVWKDYAGHVAWPTVAFAIVLPVVAAAIWGAVLSGWLPLWAGGIAMTVVVYLAFTPLHEAAHGNVGGTSARGWLDEVVGWTSATLFAAPFPAFRAIHLRHHGATNEPDRDPDAWVAGSTPWGVAARCLTVLPKYYWTFFVRLGGESPLLRRERSKAVVGAAVVIGTLIAATAAGFGPHVVVLWLAPAVFGTAILAFAFDWVPHHPHDAVGRFVDTRTVLFPGLGVISTGQSYHSVHHLWPRVPWYRYGTVFWRVRPLLEARGTPIVDLSA